MAEFNRFDICEAYNLYAVAYNGEAYTNEIHVRLSRLKFRPSNEAEYLCGLTENGREIYANLVETHYRGHVGYQPCACRDCFETAIGVAGVALCLECEAAGCEVGCDDHRHGHAECQREDAFCLKCGGRDCEPGTCLNEEGEEDDTAEVPDHA
jgi:hypothetical protein